MLLTTQFLMLVHFSASAPKQRIRDSHRRIMLLNHPDRGMFRAIILKKFSKGQGWGGGGVEYFNKRFPQKNNVAQSPRQRAPRRGRGGGWSIRSFLLTDQHTVCQLHFMGET